MDKKIPPYLEIYEKWALVIGQALLGILFLVGAFYKIPGTSSFSQEVAFTKGAGVPLAYLAVILALILEVIGGLLLIIGWKIRLTAFILALYTILLTFIFHFSFSDPVEIGQFTSHLGLIGGLLYISACKR